MSAPFLAGLVYILGFIGLGSVGLIPLRSWKILRSFCTYGEVKDRKIMLTLVGLVVAAVIVIYAYTIVSIFRCLTQTYCGPGIASGWTYLAVLGFSYVAFEVVAFVIFRFGGLGKV
jgi:hypothetical protein